MHLVSRVRVDNSTLPTYLTWFENDESKNPTSSMGNFSKSFRGRRKQIADTNNKNWRKRNPLATVMSDAEILTEERSFTDADFSYTSTTGNYRCKWMGDMASMLEGDPSHAWVLSQDIGRMQNLALTEAFARVDASAILTGELMGDLNKTLLMLRRPFSGARDMIHRVKRRVGRYMLRHHCNVAVATQAVWLEMRYGMQPLMLDVKSIIQNFDGLITQSGERCLVARAHQEASHVFEESFTDAQLSDFLTVFRASGAYEYNQFVSVDAGVRYSVEPRVSSVAQILGTRAQELPATLWELMPLSFVVDWFANVGDWIKASTPLSPDVHLLGMWHTTIDNRQCKLLPGLVGFMFDSPPRPVLGSYGSSTRKWGSYRREVHVGRPTLPTVKLNPVTQLQAIDGMALIATGIASGFRDILRR